MRNHESLTGKQIAIPTALSILLYAQTTLPAQARGDGENAAARMQLREQRQALRLERQSLRRDQVTSVRTQSPSLNKNSENTLRQSNRLQISNPQLNHLSGSNSKKVNANQLDNSRVDRINRIQAHVIDQDSIQARRAARINGTSAETRLNLGSARNVVLLSSDDLNGVASVSLALGGNSQEFHVGDKVSAAEYISIKGGAANALNLDARGRADSGSFSFNSMDGANLNVSDFVIPEGITGVRDFADGQSLSVNGDLVNRGSVLVYSTNNNVSTGNISANNIVNRRSGSIATADGSSVAHAINDFSLALEAANDISNSGRIASGGSLSLTAGNTITNAQLAGETSATPVIEAQNNVDLVAGSGTIVNAGSIRSAGQNINIASFAPSTPITVYGNTGVFDAQAGAINIRRASESNGDVSMYQGDYLSKELNIFAEKGHAFGNIGKMTGQLNTVADMQHIYASTDTMVLGNNVIAGDPTYVNTTGGIVIDGAQTFNQFLAIIANGDITAKNDAQITDAGRNVVMIAGVKSTTSGPQSSTIPGSQITSSVTVNLSSSLGNGGSIDFSTGASPLVIDTRTSTSGVPSGNITLVAVPNKTNTVGGKVLLGNNNIDTANDSEIGGPGGSVTIYAGLNPTTAQNTVTAGTISTSNPNTTSGGNISIFTQAAAGTGANNTITIDKTGTITSGTIIGTGPIFDKAGVLISGILNTGAEAEAAYFTQNPGDLTINAGGNVTTKSITTSGNSSSKAGDINITSKTGSVDIQGDVHAEGGSLNKASGGDINVNAANGTVNFGGDVRSVGLKQGQVNVQSGGDITFAQGIDSHVASISLITNTGTVNSEYAVSEAGLLAFKTNSGSFGTSAKPINFHAGQFSVVAGAGDAKTGFFGNLLNNDQQVLTSNAAGRTVQISVPESGILKTAKNNVLTVGSLLLEGGTSGVFNLTTSGITNLTAQGRFITVSNIGDMTVQSVNGEQVSLSVSSSNPNVSSVLHIAGEVSATTGFRPTVNIGVGGTATVQGVVSDSALGVINAPNVNFQGTTLSNFGTSAKPLLLVTDGATVFSASGADNLYLNQEGTIQIVLTTTGNATNAKGSEFVVTTSPNKAGLGQILLGSDGYNNVISVAGSNSKLSLQSSGATGKGGIIWNQSTPGTISASTITLADGVGGVGDNAIGTVTNPILMKATKQVNLLTKNNASISNQGDIVLNASLTPTSILTVINTGNITGSGSTIAAQQLAISATGSVGTFANPLAIDSMLLSISAGASGSVYLTNDRTGTVQLLNQNLGQTYKNGAGANYLLTSANSDLSVTDPLTAFNATLIAQSIATTGAITAGSTATLTATKAGISIGGALSADSIALSASTPMQTIVQNATGVILAKTLNLTVADQGVANLKTASNAIKGLQATVNGTGQILLKTVSNMTIGSIIGTPQILDVAYTGNLSTSGVTLSAGQVSFTPNDSSNSSIVISNKITASANVLLTASGTGGVTIGATGSLVGDGQKTINTASGGIVIGGALSSASQVSLSTNGGNIGQTTSGLITAPGQLNITMTNGGSALLNAANNAFTNLFESASGVVPAIVNVKAAGNLALNKVDGSTQSFTATAGGNISVGSDEINASTLVLTSSGTGGIGGGGAGRVKTDATTITLTAAKGNAFVDATNTGAITLKDSAAGATNLFDVTSTGAITTGSIGGGTISIEITGATTNGITIGGTLGNKIQPAGSQVTLKTGGAGNITGLANGAIGASSVTLTSNGGNIVGPSAKNELDVYTPTLSVSTNGSGSVAIEQLGSNGLTLNTAEAGVSFLIETTKQLTVGDVSTSSTSTAGLGGIFLKTSLGNINVKNNANMETKDGNILINTDATTGKIFIGSGTTILASSAAAGTGDVTINTGAKANLTPGTAPGNVTVNETLGGKVYFGKMSITALTPTNTLNAEGRNIVFSGDTVNSITLGGGVTITADPPVGSPAYLALLRAQGEQTSGVQPQSFALSAPIAPASLGSSGVSQLAAQNSFSTMPSNMVLALNAVSNASIPSMMPNLLVSAGTVLSPASTLELSQADSPFASEVSSAEHARTGSHASNISNGSDAEVIPFTGDNLLCTPTESTAIVDTQYGPLTVAPNSCVLAMRTVDGLAILNFHDQGSGSVKLRHGKRDITIAPGTQILVSTSDSAEFADVNISEHIRYANVRSAKISDQHQLFSAQFYIPSAIEAVEPVWQLVSAKDARSRKMKGNLLKTAAVLMHINGGAEGYQPHYRRTRTAYAK